MRTFLSEFYENDERKELRMLNEHNLQYAEDTCENWVEGIIK